ncbi:hypothetical protein EDD29_3290 [Actinocorallia herbida]|uniref:Uncharacterized protein n=1 Tax=Actinocorallia herbida TaxID=58109 RepID=A0A3N1CWS3_9ACTN|nr:hypothetical protein [Actinocorallia herbida]ROO85741.1 hypothetical protein EDD29_3290 [Actinocorallia herbida]
MAEAADRDMRLRQVAGRVVARAAPRESHLFDLRADEFFSREKVRLVPRRRRTPTGFGTPEVVEVLTPIILAILVGVAQDQVKDGINRGLTSVFARIRRWWLLRRAVPADPEDDLGRVDVQGLSELCRTLALHHGTTEEQADAIAEAVRAELTPP